MALGSLGWWLVTLHVAGGLKLDEHCGPFQPRPFCDSLITKESIWVGVPTTSLGSSFQCSVTLKVKKFLCSNEITVFPLVGSLLPLVPATRHL